MPALLLENLHFSYPPVLADGKTSEILQGLSLRVPDGQTLAIMGATSSGKTTLALILAGLAPQMTGGQLTGTVRVGGLDAAHTPPAHLSRTVGLAFQESERQLFNMTVAEEVAFGLEGQALPPAEIGPRVAWALQRTGLTGLEERSPWQLSGGQQKRLAIASVLALQPPILVLDEPMAGLDPAGRREVAALLNELKRTRGTTVIVLEKDAEFSARWAERVVVLQGGRVALDGPPADVFQRVEQLHTMGVATPQLAELAARLRAGGETAAFLTAQEAVAWFMPRWQAAAATLPSPPAAPIATAPLAVEVQAVTFAYDRAAPALNALSLTVPAGQFVALVGPNGGGKSTLARHLIGLLRPQRGSITINGSPAATHAVGELARTVGYVFQNPDRQLFAPSVREEVAYGARNLGLRGTALDERVEDALAAFDLQSAASMPPAVLGYGLRRLTTLASVWAMQPAIWVLDEPTTGLDARLVALLLARLHTLHAAGRTILLITHDLKLAAQAERIVALSQGEVALDGPPAVVLADEAPLTALALRPPPVTRLSARLATRGFPHPQLTVDDFLQAWNGRNALTTP